LQGDSLCDWRDAKTHALITTIWYPVDVNATESQQWVGAPTNPFSDAGQGSRDAKLSGSPKRFPLILLSHGSGGSALQIAWLGTEPAAHGYIAVVVNHPSNNSLEPYRLQGFTLWWERALDLNRAMDAILADSDLHRESGRSVNLRCALRCRGWFWSNSCPRRTTRTLQTGYDRDLR